MTIKTFRNIRVSDELPLEADLVVVSLSAESRCINVVSKAAPTANVCLAVVEQESVLPSFYACEQTLRELKFSTIKENMLEATLEAGLSSFEKRHLDAVIDISSMSREVMARLFTWLLCMLPDVELNLYVCYSLAEFSVPPDTVSPNEYIAPVGSQFAGWPAASQPTSVVVGLGYEPHKAEGAVEFLDASEQWLFIPNSPIEQFRVEVEKNNEGLVERARRSNRLVEYQVDDPSATYGQLEFLVSDLSRRSNPVLLPFGPKLFFALALLQCHEHSQAGVWAVSGERIGATVDRRPSGCVIGFHATLQ
ncbi:hypothetical protein [Pandoraea soli]|uniref:Uncharacterized protein n=1 Tax=Pandoraea soli TaxID=2508293 RepID=A0ABY6W6D6_9BURK|nr:hypothetical protein [Pandoraea soli]VVE28351.1 hypothetical protein PSO31014_03501 [Pandoraea soli]